MPLVPAKCTQCGSNLEIDSSKEAAICPFCNTPFITEKAINHYNTTNVTNIENLHADVVNILDDNSKENKVLSGDTFIKLGDYAKAESVYIELTENFPHDYRGWWGLIRVKTLDFTNCDISRTIYNELNTLYKKIETVTDTIAPEIESIYSEYIKECGKKLTSFEKNASDEMNTIDGHLDDIDKVFGASNSAYSSTIAQGIEYAVDNGADVINLSVGGQHKSECEQAAIDYAYRKNVAVVAAAGNEKLNLAYCDYSPGGLNHVITVSALAENGSLANFSNYGNGVVEFTAPGVNIKGAKLGGGYCTMNGTSMASPHVAGVYAIVKAVHPEIGIDEITEALGENARNKENSSYYGYGYIKVNALEKYLSRVFCENDKIDNVTDNSATLSGTIRYTGIIPEYVGARLGTSRNNQSDVVKVRFNDNGNDTMNFKCDLSSLKSGTTYYVCIFMKPGGFDYVSEDIEFTTTGTPSNPEPTPEPDKSELRIVPNKYPTGEIKEGSSFGLSGRIKSNCHITDVRSYILDSNYNVLQESSGWTTTQTYVIEDSKLDTGLKFAKLGVGTYYLRYYAEDETGNSVTWTSDAFKVIAEEKQPEPEPEPDISDLRILPDSYPSGQLTQGNNFGLSGRIKSNYHITDVRAYLLDSNKNVIMEASGWTTTQTYVIENSALDKGMKFNLLSAGTYYLKYTASDESGNSVSWTSDAFTVSGNISKSELRILPEKYPTGTLTKGKSFGLSGRIKSDYHITDVRAYMLDSNKNVIMEASGWTTTKTYVIEGSALDKGMRFNNLSEGGYYLKYVASDESGNTVSWTSEMFYIK